MQERAMFFGRSRSRGDRKPVRVEPPETALKDAMETLDRVIEATKANKRRAQSLAAAAAALANPAQK